MGNRKKLPHHEELTRLRVMTENQFTEKKLLRHFIAPVLTAKALRQVVLNKSSLKKSFDQSPLHKTRVNFRC
jgi:hypothetical protein